MLLELQLMGFVSTHARLLSKLLSVSKGGGDYTSLEIFSLSLFPHVTI